MRKPVFYVLGFLLVISLLGAREIFAETPSLSGKDVAVDSRIYLASDGDVNNDGQVDAGDTIVFSYTITNKTNKELSYLTVKTNIPRTRLNFVHDVKGTSSLLDNNGTIEISNLFIGANQRVMVSFDARINYFQGIDQMIWTQPKLIAQDNTVLLDTVKREINVRAWNNDMIPSILKKQKL